MLENLKKLFIRKKMKLDYKGAILNVAKGIEERDIRILDAILLESSKKRFGDEKDKIYLIIKTLIDKAFKDSKYIELADKYVIDENKVVANAYYWILGNNKVFSTRFKFYDIEKKDLGVFVDTQDGVKVNLDGLISINAFEKDIIFEKEKFKFFISIAVNYYNQKILKLKIYNKTDNRLYFRRNVDEARVRIYSNNLYEEKILGANGNGLLELADGKDFMVVSEGNIDFEVKAIEMFNFCEELSIGEYNIASELIYENNNINDFDKVSIDNEIIRIRAVVDKILECESIDDFIKITDIDNMKEYYSEFISSENIDYSEFEKKLLSSYMKILKSYRFLRISKVTFEDDFYKVKLLVEIKGTDGFIDVSINSKNFKFIFLTEYLTALKNSIKTNIILKTEKLEKESIKVVFCEKSKLFMILARAKEQYLDRANYLRINIDTDNGFFSDYLEFGKCYDAKFENSIENIETEEDVKRWQREKGYTFTSTFLQSAKSISSINIVDNTEFMTKNKVEI